MLQKGSRFNFGTFRVDTKSFEAKESLSQAAACDGKIYQIPQEQAEINLQPGVLPI